MYPFHHLTSTEWFFTNTGKKASIWARLKPNKLVFCGTAEGIAEVLLSVMRVSTGCYTSYVGKKVELAYTKAAVRGTTAFRFHYRINGKATT